MVKEMGFDAIMLLAVLFAVLAAAMSISEEIEGRTAITLMSKPVSRRQFLIGKYVGTLLAALVITGILGWLFNIVPGTSPTTTMSRCRHPPGFEPARAAWANLGDTVINFIIGIAEWFALAGQVLPGLILASAK